MPTLAAAPAWTWAGRLRHLFSLFITLLFALCVLAACGEPEPPPDPISDIVLPEPGTFEVRLTGAIEAEFSGTADALLAPMGRAIYLSGPRYSANLVLPVDQATGTYRVLPLLSAFNAAQNVQSVGGVLVDSERPLTDETGATLEPTARAMQPAPWYDVIRGRVTLLSVEPMTGAFEFTVVLGEGRSVAVSAVFNALPQTAQAP